MNSYCRPVVEITDSTDSFSEAIFFIKQRLMCRKVAQGQCLFDMEKVAGK
jgi:hypothetical protein